MAPTPRCPPRHAALSVCLSVPPSRGWEGPRVLITSRAVCAVDEVSWTGGAGRRAQGRVTEGREKTFPCSGLSDTEVGHCVAPCDASVSFSAKAHWAGRGSVSERSLVTFAKIHSVPSTGAGSGARPPGMTLEVRTRGKPPAAARELEARYKEGLPGEWMRYSHWGLYTTVLTLQQNLRFRVVCKLNGLICVNRWGEFLAR